MKELKAYFVKALIESFGEAQIDFFWRSIKEDVFASYPDMPPKDKRQYLNKLIPKIQEGEPIQYLTGYCYFYDRRLQVSPAVLIPRSETELLVHHLITALKSNPSYRKVLDIGTGSGCIPVIAKAHCTNVSIQAVDLSPAALNIAQSNADRYDTQIDFIALDFLDHSAWTRLTSPDLIVSNPPYISPTERDLMSESTLRYEPNMALYPLDEDPLVFYKAIHTYATSLDNYPILLLEINEFRAEETIRVFENRNCELIEDMENRPRVLKVE